MNPSLRLLALLALGLAALPRSGRGQAPHITPKGDPTVLGDTLYALASQTGWWHPDEPYVYLLADGVVRLDADGRGTRTYRRIAYILKPEGVTSLAELSFEYAPAHERLTINWIRVLRTDGTVISDHPRVCQESEVAAAIRVPVYVERKVQRCSLSQVAPGTIVDYSRTLEELDPPRPGDFMLSWRITPGPSTRRSRYVVDLPATMQPAIVETNLPQPGQALRIGDRLVRTWTASDLLHFEMEPLAADSNGVIGEVTITSGSTWPSLGTWFAGQAAGRDSLTPPLHAYLDSLVSQETTQLDSLRALHRFATWDVRYVAVALGKGGYQPREPADVFATRTGDCKDKALLFVAMARALGFTAYPVLLSAHEKTDARLASIEQFDHAIAMVLVDGTPVFTDLTADFVPFGELPGNDEGQFAVVVRGLTDADTVRLPHNAQENQIRRQLNGTLTPEGRIDASYLEEAFGTTAAEAYIAMGRSTGYRSDSEQHKSLGLSIAARYFPGAKPVQMHMFERPRSAAFVIGLQLRDWIAGKRLDSHVVLLTLPFSPAKVMSDLANELEARGPRRFTLDAEALLRTTSHSYSMRLTLPEGWKARLPAPVEVRGVWGTYTMDCRQDERDLVLHIELSAGHGIQPPEALVSLIEWLRAVARDESGQIVLDTGTGSL